MKYKRRKYGHYGNGDYASPLCDRVQQKIDFIPAHYNGNTTRCEYSQTDDYDVFLVAGVEDGWIKVDKEVWEKYLKAKERLNLRGKL